MSNSKWNVDLSEFIFYVGQGRVKLNTCDAH